MIHSAKACFTAAAAMIAGGNRPSLTEARAERAGGIWALGNKFKTRFCRNMILHNTGQPHGVAPTVSYSAKCVRNPYGRMLSAPTIY